MSTFEARKLEADAERATDARYEDAMARRRLAEQRRASQGEFLGDMAGGFGAFVGSRRMQILIGVIKSSMLVGFGAVAIYALAKAI